MRGVSRLVPILLSLRDLGDSNRATVVKQKVAALLTGFITTPNNNPLPGHAGGRWRLVGFSGLQVFERRLVDVRGLEPLASALRTPRSPN